DQTQRYRQYNYSRQPHQQVRVVKVFRDGLIPVCFLKLQFLRHLLDGELQVQGGIFWKMADAVIAQHFEYRQAILLDRFKGKVGQKIDRTVQRGAVLGIGSKDLLVQKLHTAILVAGVGEEHIKLGRVSSF